MPVGLALLVGVLLIVGLAGLAAAWVAWPRTPTTSPLAALFALVWGCTHLVAATLSWRRSAGAAPALVAAVGLLLFPAAFLAPGGELFLPSFVVVALIAFLGFRYLRRHSRDIARRSS